MQIFIGIVLGIALALLAPEAARAAMLLGELFVQALKAVAPVLVLVLVASAIANRGASHMGQMRPILLMYLVGTVLAALLAVLLSVLFPTSLNLVVGQLDATAPQGISEVLRALLEKLVDNPLNAMLTGNYIGIVVWGVLLGIFLHSAADTTRRALGDLSDAVTAIVRIVIRLAPIGIFGLVAGNLAVAGLGVLEDYARILTVLLSAMLIMALVVNPFIAWVAMRRNPYPLVFTALRVSGLTAFFTRSSAANIPVNLALCERLNLERDTYAVSIPLGATINMGGAAITITVLTLAATHTLGINVDLATALLLSVVAALSACGASGVAGGSLLLIPLSCGLFGISDDVAMQVVAVGFMISILQDSAETALNSSTDVVFTAAVASPGKLNVRRPLILLLLALIAGAIAGSLVTRWYQTRDVPVAPSKLVRDLVTNPAMPEAVVEGHRKDNFSTLGSVPEIMQLPGAFTRSEALHVLAGRADGAAVQGHIFAAARIVDDVEREQALGILFARLAEIDPASALALARTEHFDALRSIESTVWSTWARKDLDAALFAAKTQTTSVNQNVAAQALYAAFGFMGNDITDRIETELGIGPDRSQRANYLYRIADSSPAKAIDYIDAMPPGREKSWNVNWLAYYLALRDPEEAQAFAARFESPAERQQFSDVLAAEAARANPRLVIDRLLAAGSAGNTTEFHSAIQALAETDPETADAYFRSARNSQMRQMIGFGIVGALAGTDPAAAIAWARENDRGGNDNFEMIALMALARHDPQRALVEAQNGTNPGMRESLVSNVVGVVAADDPRKALLMSQSLEDPRLRESSELHVAQAWLAQDPDAALAWLDTLDEAKARAIIDNSGWSLLHSDVDAAMRLLPRVSDDKQHMWRSQIAAQLSQTRSPDEALAFIRQFEGDANYPQLQAEVVGSIAVTDVARARQLADQLGELGSRDSAYLQIAAQQAAASPADAMLTAQQIADVNIRAEATAAAITQAGRQDPAVASRMVAQLQPGPARDLAIVQVMSDWSNLESMEGLIDTIEDPDLRSQAKMNRLYYAAENDPARARALLADPEIPAEMREEFQSMLENGGVRID